MKKYWLIIKNTWNEYLEYRLNFILWRVRVVIRFLITYFLWSAIYTNNQQFFGYSRQGMLTYVLLLYVVSNFVFATRTQDVGAEINEGRLTNYLLKPINYFGGLISRDMSDKLLNFGFTVIETALIFIILKPPIFIQTSVWLIALALGAFVGSVVVYFNLSLLLGFIGFWTAEVWAARFIFIIVVDYLAGSFFPIDILPAQFARLLMLTPFPYIYYFPVKLYLGNLNQHEIWSGFVIMIFWVLALSYLVANVWRRGLKIYSAEGR